MDSMTEPISKRYKGNNGLPSILSNFGKIPLELLLCIANMLPRKADLSRFSKCSRILHTLLSPGLFRNVDIVISQNRDFYEEISKYHYMGPNHMFIKSISIRNRCSEDLNPYGSTSVSESKEDAERPDQYAMFDEIGQVNLPSRDRARDLTVAINQSIYQFLSSLTATQLKSFAWYSRFPIARKVYEYVLRHHRLTLESLSVSEAPIPGPFHNHPGLVLKTLECRSVQNLKTLEHVKALVTSNADALHTLKLGRERQLVTKYLERFVRDPTVTRDTPEDNDALFIIALTDPWVLKLRCLELYGLDLPSSTGGLTEGIDPTSLRRLCLESCDGVERVLCNLTENTHHPLNLQELVLRIENPTQLTNKALYSFLTSFSGLKVLSVLIETTDPMPRVDCFLEAHGPTLQVLVWEGRKSPRHDNRDDTSHTLGSVYDPESEISKILSQCTKLVELSIAWDWDDRSSWNLQKDYATRTGFLNLPNLRTLHIRNSPIMDLDVDDHSSLYIPEIVHFTHARAYDLLVHGLALDYSHGGAGNVSPALQVLIVGPLTYSQHWGIAFMDWDVQHPFFGVQPPFHGPKFAKWRRPIVFSIELLHSRFGRRILALDQYRFETVRELANFFSVNCLDSVWLN